MSCTGRAIRMALCTLAFGLCCFFVGGAGLVFVLRVCCGLSSARPLPCPSCVSSSSALVQVFCVGSCLVFCVAHNVVCCLVRSLVGFRVLYALLLCARFSVRVMPCIFPLPLSLPCVSNLPFALDLSGCWCLLPLSAYCP